VLPRDHLDGGARRDGAAVEVQRLLTRDLDADAHAGEALLPGLVQRGEGRAVLGRGAPGGVDRDRADDRVDRAVLVFVAEAHQRVELEELEELVGAQEPRLAGQLLDGGVEDVGGHAELGVVEGGPCGVDAGGDVFTGFGGCGGQGQAQRQHQRGQLPATARASSNT
jgi:hypothetical protein